VLGHLALMHPFEHAYQLAIARRLVESTAVGAADGD
jgi:hypothetical protein